MNKFLFNSNDPKIILENLESVLELHFKGEDMSFYSQKIIFYLYSEDKRIQLLSLRALSVILPQETDLLDNHINILQKFLKSDEFKTQTLRFLSFIQNDFIYSKIREQIIDLFETGNLYIRKLSYLDIFNAVKRSQFWIDDFLHALSRSFFDRNLFHLSIQMLTELYDKKRPPFDNLVMGVIPEIANFDFYLFSKICILFSRTNGDYLLDAAYPFVQNRYQDGPNYCLASLPLVRKTSAHHPLKKALTEKLEYFLQTENDEQKVIQYAFALSQVKSFSQLSMQIRMKLLTSNSAKVRFLCMLLMKTVDDSLKRTMEEVLSNAINNDDINFVSQVMALIPSDNGWYSSYVSLIYKKGENWTTHVAAEALRKLKVESLQDLLAYFRSLEKIPDDEFGIEISKIVAQSSDQQNDFSIILPKNISSYSENFITNALNDATILWMRLQFKVDESVNTILDDLINNNKSREIRNRALELKNLTLEEKPN